MIMQPWEVFMRLECKDEPSQMNPVKIHILCYLNLDSERLQLGQKRIGRKRERERIGLLVPPLPARVAGDHLVPRMSHPVQAAH